jgi:glutamyl-tRNA reductase
MAGTTQRPLLLLDLSVPRNIEAEAGGLDGITLVDLDELHTPVVAAQAARMASVPAAEQILTQELSDFLAWLADRPAREAIRPLREALDEICRREVAFAAGDEVADRLANRIVAKLLAHPMRSLRLAAERGEPIEPLTGALQTLFNLSRPGRDEGTAHGQRETE